MRLIVPISQGYVKIDADDVNKIFSKYLVHNLQ